MISRKTKEEKIARLIADLAGAEALIIAENKGLSVVEMNNLRVNLRDCQGKVQVVKNTLARLAIKGGVFESIGDKLSGPLMYGVGTDVSGMAKVFVDAAKKNPKLLIRGGALAGFGSIDEGGVIALSKLPNREQLLASVVGTMQMPIVSFVRLLQEIPTRFVRTVASVRDKSSH